MAFSEQLLEEIQGKSEIVEIISGYIPLKRSGRNFKANCPFHKEKTPSFMVSPAKQIFHCFGCGVGGDVFNFVMKLEGIEFPDAVRMLAEKAGVAMPHFSRSDFERSSNAVQIYKINELTSGYYHDMLLKSPQGKAALAYLKGRGINTATIEKTKLGYASESWDGLIGFARERGFNPSLLERAGLVTARQEGGYYDRFRNKIMFPIFDLKERVVAFGARVLDDSLPKYINSPETGIYIKGRHLYGLNFSCQAAKEKDSCIIVEGYLDFLLPHQSGVSNLAACLGTSLTSYQVRLVKRYTRNVVILYDGDSAGEAASLRGLDLLVQEGVNVRVATLPFGYDPDSFVKEKGPAAFNSIVASASELFDYKLKVLTARYDAGNSEAKTKICAEMLPTISRITDYVLRFEYIRRLSEKLQVREEALLAELKKIKPDYTYDLSEDKLTQMPPSASKAEMVIVGLMLEDSEIVASAKERLKPDDFSDEKMRKIVNEIFKIHEDGGKVKITRFITCFKDDDTTRIISEAAVLTEGITDKQKNLDDCVKRIREEKDRNRFTELRNLINIAQTMGDDKRVAQLLFELNGMIKSSSVCHQTGGSGS